MEAGGGHMPDKDPVAEEFKVEEFQDEGPLSEFQSEEASDTEEESQEELGEDTQEEEDTEAESEEEETKPEPKKYKVKGQEYTLEELAEKGLLDDIVTQSEQVTHYQDLYHGAKQEADALKQQVPQPQPQRQPQPQTQPVTPDQIKAAMQPFLRQAVDQGYMEPEFVEDFPAMAATQMQAYSKLMQLEQVVTGMYQYFMRENAERMYKQVKGNFDSSCQALTSKHPVYANLADQAERDRFFDFVSTKVNPEAGAINEEFLGRIYLSYQQDSILTSMQQGSGKKQSKRKKQRKLAVGEGGPAPRKGSQGRTPSDDETVIAGMFDHFMKQHS